MRRGNATYYPQKSPSADEGSTSGTWPWSPQVANRREPSASPPLSKPQGISPTSAAAGAVDGAGGPASASGGLTVAAAAAASIAFGGQSRASSAGSSSNAANPAQACEPPEPASSNGAAAKRRRADDSVPTSGLTLPPPHCLPSPPATAAGRAAFEASVAEARALEAQRRADQDTAARTTRYGHSQAVRPADEPTPLPSTMKTGDKEFHWEKLCGMLKQSLVTVQKEREQYDKALREQADRHWTEAQLWTDHEHSLKLEVARLKEQCQFAQMEAADLRQQLVQEKASRREVQEHEEHLRAAMQQIIQHQQFDQLQQQQQQQQQGPPPLHHHHHHHHHAAGSQAPSQLNLLQQQHLLKQRRWDDMGYPREADPYGPVPMG
eukprot:gene15603-23812_t